MIKKMFVKAAIATSILFAVHTVSAETAEISKPKGAMGTGTAKMGQAKSNQFWWPDQLDLSSLRDHDLRSNPYGPDFNYADHFSKLDLAAPSIFWISFELILTVLNTQANAFVTCLIAMVLGQVWGMLGPVGKMR